MHDNACPQASRVTTYFFETECIAVLERSAWSPDLNPVEHLLDILKTIILLTLEFFMLLTSKYLVSIYYFKNLMLTLFFMYW